MDGGDLRTWADAGGIAGLALFVEENFEGLEAAFARIYPGIYGGDLGLALWGPDPMSVRRLRSLLGGLAQAAEPA